MKTIQTSKKYSLKIGKFDNKGNLPITADSNIVAVTVNLTSEQVKELITHLNTLI